MLSRERLEWFFSKGRVDTRHFLTDLLQIAEFVTPGQSRLFIRDPKDEPFLALVGTKPLVDALITGDKDFTEASYGGIPVYTPALLARLLGHSS